LLINGSSPQTWGEIPAITADEVREAKTFFPLEKFFIFGHARSGTTLLARLVRLHPKVHCNYQAHFFTRLPLLQKLVADEEVRMWFIRRSNRWNRGSDLSPVVLRSVSDFIMERDARQAGKGTSGCLVGDKSPNNLLNGESVELMTKIYPDARLIFIVRDGRDSILSHRFQAFIDRAEYLSKEDLRIRQEFIDNPSSFYSGTRSLFSEKGLRESAKGWAHNLVDTNNRASELLGERYYHLRYEDLLSNPLNEMNNLWTLLGVDPTVVGLNEKISSELQQNPDADWQEAKAGEIYGSLTKGKRGNWRDLFNFRDRQIFKEVAGETLIRWGYEQNLEW
jgi:hypothetical protein